jgi:hypothetical protein
MSVAGNDERQVRVPHMRVVLRNGIVSRSPSATQQTWAVRTSTRGRAALSKAVAHWEARHSGRL